MMRAARLSALAFLALPLALLPGCGGGKKVTVHEAWVRLAAVPGRPAAAYFTIRGGRADDRLTGVASALVGRIELHRSMGAHDGGMAGMRPLAEVAVPAGGEIRFAPGGNHAMLFGVNPAIRPGTELPLALRFASGAQIEVSAKSVAAGDDAPFGS